MIKYSFIVPVYNTEKYLKRCLDSLIRQTFLNFEIIIINDGSTDNSDKIMKKYEEKYSNVKVISQKNQGLSMARNEGVKKAKGKYIIFIDSDDYVEKNLLEEVDKKIGDNDILRFQIVTENEDNTNKIYFEEKEFTNENGPDAFRKITSYHFVETAWCYVFSRKFWNENNFEFFKGVYHEDFGLIPYVIYKAKKVSSISFIGYHYVQRNGSIINNKDYEKTVKKAFDMLLQYENIKSLFKSNTKNHDNYLLSYMANCAIVKSKELIGTERKKYIKRLKEIKVVDDVIINTFSRKLKKILMKINLGFYLRVVK